MQIGGLQKLTLIDFPGKLACTVFCLGCNFRCPFCYNPELVLPKKIKNQPRILERLFFNFLKERKGLLEGVTIGGGEPTIYKDLPDFIKKIKKLDYLVKLDTNGSNPRMLKDLIDQKLVDYVAMDIKAPKERYYEVVGRPKKENAKLVKDVEKSIKILKDSNIDFEFRTTVIPIILEKDDILRIARWIEPAKKYYLQNFRPEKTLDPKFEKIKPYPQEYMLEILKAVAPFFEFCQLR